VCKLDASHKETREGSPTLGHDWNDTKELIPATETKNSMNAITCKRDKTHVDETIIARDAAGFEYATGTVGLGFVLLTSGDAYCVSKGTATGAAIHIPAFHRPDASSSYLPVTEISNGTNLSNNNAFGGTSSSNPNTAITGVTFAPETELTIIRDYAFYNCTKLANITIPSGVTSIGRGAFYLCSSLASVTIPSSVTFIDAHVFNGCSSLASVTIPSGVTSIGISTFGDCTKLANITIPSSVTSIESWAFYGCSSLTSVTFADTIAAASFDSDSFPGDLRAKFYATEPGNGTPGRYTATGTGNSKVWTKQP